MLDRLEAERLARIRQSLSHATRVVIDSPSALAAALEFKPDVVFLDLGMPDLNGFDLARQLRCAAGLQHSWLAALSGWGTDEDRAKSRNVGMDHHLTKPVMLDEVVDMLALAARPRAEPVRRPVARLAEAAPVA